MERKNWQNYKSARTSLDDLKKKIEDLNSPKKKNESLADERIYKYSADKAGNAYVLMRFLPSINDVPPVVSNFSHFFDNLGKWYVELCPTTIKQKCPVCSNNSDLWNDGTQKSKDIVHRRRRLKQFYSNVYIIKDTNNPSNDGKVFIWQYGQKVFNIINEKLSPQVDENGKYLEEPIDIFDLFKGATFKLKIKKVGGYSNYDSSQFDNPSPLSTDEKKLEEIYNQIYDLTEYIDPTKFKPYDELKKRLDFVNSDSVYTKTIEDDDESATEEVEVEESEKEVVEEKVEKPKKEPSEKPADSVEEFFKNL